MDSGSAVPTLNRGCSKTVAANVLIVARGRSGGACALAADGKRAVRSVTAAFMLARNAFFFAVERAGRRSPAMMAMIETTTSNSIRVKARGLSFMRHLMGCSCRSLEHGLCHGISHRKQARLVASARIRTLRVAQVSILAPRTRCGLIGLKSARSMVWARAADWEIGDTAGLETC